MNDSVSPIRIAMKARSGKRAKAGHPWIFSNEIEHPKPLPDPGEIVTVQDERSQFVGYAGYNPHSLISLRVLSRNKNDFPGSVEWFQKRIQQAVEYRKRVYPQRNSYRLVYSDSDHLPGVIVDKYEDVLVAQILTSTMERLTDNLVEALKETISPRAILLRNQTDMRDLEHLPKYDKPVLGDVPPEIVIDENGVKLAVDIMGGQKTGHFFDQADNRQALAKYAAGADVLDVFCYTGAWSLHLLKAGAAHAVAVDSAEPALIQAEKNAELNGVSDRIELVQADAFDWFAKERSENKKYGIVIVDPPAFAKSGKQVPGALRGYEDINRQAIHLLREGGILCACSCSYHVSEEMFLEALQKAATREGRQIRLLEIRTQAADHSILLSMPESRYLKCIIGVVERW